MTREFGNEIDHHRVDRFFGVSVPTTEGMLRTFPGISRRQTRVIPNFIDTAAYRHSTDPARVFRLAMVGTCRPVRGTFGRSSCCTGCGRRTTATP